ncbi:MAG: hypothetical protein KDK91_33080, partial [Gammaproteobacteria bacterium]|nr:hypothetical protein [Gammaproteobacteria bacterium]
APRLGGQQRWLLVDEDHGLLEQVPRCTAAWARRCSVRTQQQGDALWLNGANFKAEVRTVQLDLANGLETLETGDAPLLTASALLDLVSQTWLERLIGMARRTHASLLLALSYDGRIALEPGIELDAQVAALVNQHQLTDKGFGAALGPAAVGVAEQALRSSGFSVHTARSDWLIGAATARRVGASACRGTPARQDPGSPVDACIDTVDGTALRRALIDGWCSAAIAMAPERAAALEAWRTRRLAAVSAAGSVTRVGHQDLLALPQLRSGEPLQVG